MMVEHDQSKETHPMQIHIQIGDQQLVAILEDSGATRDLAAQLLPTVGAR
jgi:hypothetical protein